MVGTPKDLGKAFRQYQLAADQGDRAGRTNLALLYQKGRGVPKNIAMADQLTS
eukprot:m.189303 g.189303  ORF g.189303 m.189303 type:complete len:53 (+) comp15106_c0_seq2:1630-1788(+)